LRGGAVLIEKRLQDESCGHLVDNFAMILPLVARLVKNLVSFFRCQPLVPQVDRQSGHLAELSGKGVSFLRLSADLS